jgi:hypothetical protein
VGWARVEGVTLPGFWDIGLNGAAGLHWHPLIP